MKSRFLTFVACFALVLSVFAGATKISAAPVAAATPVPRTMPDFSSMKIFLGTWNCAGIVRGKNRPDTGTTTISLDGAYMVTHDVAPPFDKYRTRAITSESYLTYNPSNHMWMTIGVDSFGGYSVSSSPGWRGNTLTTTTKMTAGGGSGSDVLTKISDTKTSDVSVSTDAKGHVTHNKTVCTKA